jgi:hypothetical protein
MVEAIWFRRSASMAGDQMGEDASLRDARTEPRHCSERYAAAGRAGVGTACRPVSGTRCLRTISMCARSRWTS